MPEVASGPSPSVRSVTTRSVGGSGSKKSISGLSMVLSLDEARGEFFPLDDHAAELGEGSVEEA